MSGIRFFEIRGGSPASLIALLLLASLLGCSNSGDGGYPVPDPSVVRPILCMWTGDPEDVSAALAAIRKAGVSAEFRHMRDVPVEQRGFWADKEDGWLLFVRGDEADRAMAVYDAWSEEFWIGKRDGGQPATVEPLALGTAGELDTHRIKAIHDELVKRKRLDQAIRRDPKRHGEMPSVDAENTSWLMNLVREIGWIDVDRFGGEAAEAAFLLMQHSGDLSLMKAALPEIEKDVRTGGLDAQDYALLFDRIALLTGGQQRYGTQVVVRPSGKQVVERLEDPDNVDARRREIGLGPLEDYLDGIGGEIRIER